MSEKEKQVAENIAKKSDSLNSNAQDVILAFAQGMVAGMKQTEKIKTEQKD